MRFPEQATVHELRKLWTDRIVQVKPGIRPDLIRFEALTGRIVTINFGGRAIVDFGDGAWYDIANFARMFNVITDPEQVQKYDATANSAQILPVRQS